MARSFNGTSDKLQLAGETTMRWEYTQAQSGSLWVKKSSSAASACIVGKANNAPPATDQRGWAFNVEAVTGTMRLSFHLVNDASPAVHAYKIAKEPGGVITGMQYGFWLPVAWTYNGNGLTSGMKLYANGVLLSTDGTPVDSLAGNTILVNGTPVTICGFDTEFSAASVCNVILGDVEWTAAEVAKLHDIRYRDVDPSTFLSAAPKVWLPLLGSDLTDHSGNGHNASVAGGSPAQVTDPSVVFDTFSSFNITSTGSATHTPNGHVDWVIVLIAQDTVSTDLISGVTYGGVSLQRVPNNGLAQDAAGEPGAVYAYAILNGPAIPQGAQTVSVTVSSGTDLKTVFVISGNSLDPAAIAASAKQQGDAANPSVTLGTASSFAGFVANVLYSGQDSLGGVTEGSGYVRLGGGRDFGSQVCVAEAANKDGASVASGYTATSEDVAMIALALQATRQQLLAPSADSVDGAWLDQDGGSSLAVAIDDVTVNDADFIRSEAAPSNSSCRVKVANGMDPLLSTGHVIHWRVSKDVAGGSQIDMTVSLYQGGGNSLGAGTLIASFSRTNVDGSGWTTYDEALSGGQADSITDYTDLYLEFKANQP